MKPAPFEYLAPDSLSAVVEIMSENGEDAKLLAGGQSLIPAMNFRLVQPMLMVDLNKVSELDYIRTDENGELHIGAMTRQRTLEMDPVIAHQAPLIAETMPHVAHLQIRNRGTIGGSLVHDDPAAELPVILVALDGRMLVRSQSGDRWVNAMRFFQGLFTTDVKPEEVLVEIAIPPMAPNTGWSFLEFARRKGDYALLGVAALMTLDSNGHCIQSRLVYLNAGDTPCLAQEAAEVLLNEKPSSTLYKEAAELADAAIQPTGNIHASVLYLRHLSRVLTIRALEQATTRARQRIQ
jgi:CO/xanthine dehydrogenase FAD-binding subunit